MTPIAMTDIMRARQRLRPLLQPTPVEDASALGDNIHFKLENLNQTRSFKIRGALNAMRSLTGEEKAKGVVACSAGNHAQGVAYAAALSGVVAKVVMPTHTPQRKVDGAKRYGADIILHGDTYDDAEVHALQLATDLSMTFVSPYNHPQVVAGQGTVGLELFEDLPGLARVLVPTSGGGLLAGIGLVCKTINPHCEVIGVQSDATPAMYNHFYGTAHPQQETIAEGLSGEIEAGSITRGLCKDYADSIVLVTEDDIKTAIGWMLQHHNWVIEGAAAVGIAALLTAAITPDDRQTAIVISGGNIDFDTLRKFIA